MHEQLYSTIANFYTTLSDREQLHRFLINTLSLECPIYDDEHALLTVIRYFASASFIPSHQE